jgi:hypothetical protein
MSKREKRNAGEDGYTTALKLFGTVATVAVAGYQAVRTIRAGSFQPVGGHHVESIPGYLKSQILSEGSSENTASKAGGEKKGSSYTMQELEILKQNYSEENKFAVQERNFKRQRWLIDTLELLENIIESRKEVKRRLDLGDFSQSSNNLEKMHHNLRQRLQKESSVPQRSPLRNEDARSSGFLETIGTTMGLRIRQGSSFDSERDPFTVSPSKSRTDRKRRAEESNANNHPGSDDRKGSLRPRSATNRRTCDRPPMVVEMASPPKSAARLLQDQAFNLSDTEEQSVRSKRSLGRRAAARNYEGQLKSPSPRDAKIASKNRAKAKRCSGGRSSVAARNHQHRLCPDDLVGLNVFFSCPNKNSSENNDGVHGTIVEAVVDDLHDPSNLDLARFRVKIGDEIVDKTYEDLRKNITWPIKDIIDHEGPLEPEDDGFKGSLYNVKVAWGRCGASCFDPTWESLQNIADGDPASCLRYAKRKGLLNTPGWDFLKGNEYAKNGENNSSDVQTDFTVEHEKNSIADDDSSNDNDSEEDQNDSEWDGDIAVAVSQESATMPFGLENDQREGEIQKGF